MVKAPLQLALPPAGWSDNGVQGISIGQCIEDALEHGYRRGGGIRYEFSAHAHNAMFHKDGSAMQQFGWICTQPLDAKRYTSSTSELGTLEPSEPNSPIMVLTNPSRLAFHEYAHILVPWEVFVGKPRETDDGHGPRWRAMITELGYPGEAERYDLRLNLMKGPAKRAGFLPGQTVWIHNSPQILPKYLQGERAKVIKVGRVKLVLEFFDFETNMTLWPYELVSRVDPLDLQYVKVATKL